MVTFTVIVATGGNRPSLLMTVATVISQLESGDELMVERLDCNWGHAARQQAMSRAAGTHLLFIDDDDIYFPAALDRIRHQVEQAADRVHIFKMMLYEKGILWAVPMVLQGNVGTPMFCVPNVPGLLGRWGDRYEGDFDFLNSTLALHDEEPLFHDICVALIDPPFGDPEQVIRELLEGHA